MEINTTIRTFKETGGNTDFVKLYNHVFPDFRYWYRHTQRYVKMDRQTLLCEFQYVLLRAIRGFNTDSPVPDGFVRYFRAAAKKHTITLRREASGTAKAYSLKQDWDVPDPKSLNDSEYLEIIDLVNNCLIGDEQQVLTMRLAGEQSDDIKSKVNMSEFQYREAVRNIKSNRRLQKALSRD